MTGPLHILRSALHDEVRIDDSTPGTLRVGDTTLSMDTQTEYRQKRGSGAPYTLGSIWALYYQTEVMKSNWTDYVRTCKENNIFPCIFQDKVEIIDWLKGTRPTVSGIVEDTVEPTATAPSAPAQAPIAPAAPFAFADYPLREAELPERPEVSMELAITTAAPVERGGTVEYEKIRMIDSVLVCPYDFSEMANRRIVLESSDRTKRQASAVEDPTRRPRGEADESFFTMSRPELARRFQNPIVLVSMSAKSRINYTNIEKFLNDGE